MKDNGYNEEHPAHGRIFAFCGTIEDRYNSQWEDIRAKKCALKDGSKRTLMGSGSCSLADGFSFTRQNP